MDVKGKVVQLLAPQTGQGKRGPWKKQEFILETQGQFPKKVCISIWGDKIDQFGLSTGENITASVELESREYNGRWYTEARAWKVAKDGGGGTPASSRQAADVGDEPFKPTPENMDDLPF
jgi:hypothetical protein